MAKKNVAKAIAQNIVLAQVASDGEKNIPYIRDIMGQKSNSAYYGGYEDKDHFILEAILLICRNKNTDFRFSVTYGGTVSNYLVYFTFYIEGERYQVSFHSFCDDLGRFVRGSKQTRWDCKTSRGACVKLAAFYGLE